VSGPFGGKCAQTWMTITPSKPTYASGEQVVLNVRFTNHSAKACQMVNLTEGNLTIGAMTRDGQPVVPKTTYATYYAGMTEALLKHLVTVPSHGSVVVPWESDDWAESNRAYTLKTTSLVWDDSGDVAFWSVRQKSVGVSNRSRGGAKLTVNLYWPFCWTGQKATSPESSHTIDVVSSV
jgi:hypothetical protein